MSFSHRLGSDRFCLNSLLDLSTKNNNLLNGKNYDYLLLYTICLCRYVLFSLSLFFFFLKKCVRDFRWKKVIFHNKLLYVYIGYRSASLADIYCYCCYCLIGSDTFFSFHFHSIFIFQSRSSNIFLNSYTKFDWKLLYIFNFNKSHLFLHKFLNKST